MKHIIIGLLAAAVMYVEYLLCTKFRNPLLGGILPLIAIAGTAYLVLSGRFSGDSMNIYPFLILIVFLLGDWISGREKYKKNQALELKKMKAQDI